MFDQKNIISRLRVWLGGSIPPRRRSGRAALGLIQLEDRDVPATITWTNRGTDDFGTYYGANAAAARAVVDAAIADWSAVIANFNYSSPYSNTFSVNISAADLGPGFRGVTTVTGHDSSKKPVSASIILDDNGGDYAGVDWDWYFDAVPQDNAEFTSLNSRFDATFSAAAVRTDLYRTITHELGHAFGISVDSRNALYSQLTRTGTDAVDLVSDLYTYSGSSSPITLTYNGGGHLYEVSHPNDLLNAGRAVPNSTVVRRQLISDLDATLLSSAYGYTVNMPSSVETFLVNQNATTGNVVVNGEIGTTNDVITLIKSGSNTTITVDGAVRTLALGSNTVTILAGAGNDEVYISNGNMTSSVTVYGGSGYDTVIAYGSSGNDTANLIPAPTGGTGYVEIGGSTHRVTFDDGVDQANYASEGGTDAAYALPSTTTTFYGLRTVGGSLAVATYGGSGNDIATLTPAPTGGFGSVAVSDGATTYKTVYFNDSVGQVNYYSQGGTDVVYAPLNTTNTLYAFRTVGGSLTVVARGTSNNDIVVLTPVPAGGGSGNVSGSSGAITYKPIYFDGTVAQVNYESTGGTDEAYALLSTTTTFWAFRTGGGWLTLSTFGTSGNDTAFLTPAPAGGGYGNVAIGGVYKSVFFDNSVDQVNYSSQGGTDAAYALPSTTTTFYGLRTVGGSLAVATYGGSGNDIATLTPAPTGGFGSVAVSDGVTTYKTVYFNDSVGQVNFYGLDGNDTLYVNNPTSTLSVYYFGGNGTDTLRYRNLTYITLDGTVESWSTY